MPSYHFRPVQIIYALKLLRTPVSCIVSRTGKSLWRTQCLQSLWDSICFVFSSNDKLKQGEFLCSFLMHLELALQLGSVFVWTYGYSLLRSASQIHEERELENGLDEKIPNVDYLNTGETSKLLTTVQIIPEVPSSGGDYPSDKQSASSTVALNSSSEKPSSFQAWIRKVKRYMNETGHLILEVLIAPPTVGVFVLLPVIGIFIVKGASHLGLLPADPLYHYVLMIQHTVPLAMSIGTIAQLFNVGEQDCFVLFLWTYLLAAISVTFWSTVYMWILFS